VLEKSFTKYFPNNNRIFRSYKSQKKIEKTKKGT